MNNHRSRCALAGTALAAALSVMACGGEPGFTEDEPGAAREPIAGGIPVVGAPGVVDFTIPGHEGSAVPVACTGSMIAPNVILTAAHCFKLGLLGLVANQTTGTFMTTISYYDPFQGMRRPVFEESDGPATWLARNYHYDADFPGDANDDLGVVIVPGTFRDTTYHDYKRLYDDLDGPISSGFLKAYGAGVYTWDGDYDNELRRASFEVESVSPEHIVTDNQEQQTCVADSGGPLIKVSSTAGQPNSLELLVGVLSQHEGNPDSAHCADNNPYFLSTGGDNSAWCKIKSNFWWLQDTVGLDCTRLSGTSTYFYRRCFKLPFIEDVLDEGLSQGLETAIAMAVF
jgi:hypothetical protein